MQGEERSQADQGEHSLPEIWTRNWWFIECSSRGSSKLKALRKGARCRVGGGASYRGCPDQVSRTEATGWKLDVGPKTTLTDVVWRMGWGMMGFSFLAHGLAVVWGKDVGEGAKQ